MAQDQERIRGSRIRGPLPYMWQALVIVLLLSCLMNKNLPFDVRLARAFLFLLRCSGRPTSGAPLSTQPTLRGAITLDMPVTRCATTSTACAGLARHALNTLRHLSRSVKHMVLRAPLAPRISRSGTSFGRSYATAQRAKAKPIECRPGVNALRCNITFAMQNRSGSRR